MCRFWRLTVAVVLGMTAGLGSAGPTDAGTGFGLPVGGVKKVELRDEVGMNQIVFLSTAPLEEIHGTAPRVTGAIEFDPGDVEGLQGSIQVDVRSMRTGISKRDRHLYSKDWLDAERYPRITFVLKGLEGVTRVETDAEEGESTLKGTALGELSLHGITKEMKIPFRATYVVESEKTRKRALGDFLMIQADLKVSLKDYEVKGVRGLVGSRVGEVIEVRASVYGSTGVEREGP